MATDRGFDDTVSTWLEAEAPTRLPERVLSATFERTRRSTQRRGWRALLGGSAMPFLVPALALTAVVAVAALALIFPFQSRVGGPLAPDDPRRPFVGVWVSTSDADGGTQTMAIRPGVDGALDMVVRDDVATVCARTPSTMTATGRVENRTELVFAAPDYTCDDGREARAVSGPPLQEQLRNLTFVHNRETDSMTDTFGGIWTAWPPRVSPSRVSPGPVSPAPEPTLEAEQIVATGVLTTFAEGASGGARVSQAQRVSSRFARL